MNIAAFLIAALIYVASLYISTIRWRLLLMNGFGMKRLFSLCLLGSFFNTFLPGLIGGDAVKAYYLYKETGKMGQTLASVFMDRYIGFVALMLIGIVAFPFGFSYFSGSWVEWTLPFIVLSFILISLIFFGLKIGKRFGPVKEIYGYFDVYKRRKALMTETLALSFLVQFCGILSVYVLALGLGLEVPPVVFLMFLPIIIALSTAPVSISGLGIREASFVLLFGFVGVRQDMATALSFSWFLSMAAGSLAGLIEFIRYKGDKIPDETKIK
jgi:uncharacterized membrane protein YbhN (UPF0104 family)